MLITDWSEEEAMKKKAEPKVEETKEPIEDQVEPEPETPEEDQPVPGGEPDPRFHGDPLHAQYLLSDPERRNEGIKYVAEHAWRRYRDTDEDLLLGDFDEFDDLPVVGQTGMLMMVTGIVQRPNDLPYPATMPANGNRKAYRALDDAIRDTMGYARVHWDQEKPLF